MLTPVRTTQLDSLWTQFHIKNKSCLKIDRSSYISFNGATSDIVKIFEHSECVQDSKHL